MSEPTWAAEDPLTVALDRLRRTGVRPPMPSTTDTTNAASAVAEKLLRSDIATREFARQTESIRVDTPYRIHAPAHVLGERNLILGGLLASSVEGRLATMPAAREFGTGEVLRAAVLGLSASPYLWLDRVEDETNAAPLPPRHVVSRGVLPEPRMWWTTENSYDMHDPDGAVIMIRDALLVADAGDHIAVYTIGRVGSIEDVQWQTSTHCIIGQSIPYGMTYPDDCPEGSVEAMGQMLGKLAFLNSPYIPKTRQKAGRPERRAAKRDGYEMSDVTFVDLRRPTSPRREDEPQSEHDVDWQHQWVVHGHYRAQWYPSESAHHVIYIAPYLKGPEDKPLLEHTFRVRR